MKKDISRNIKIKGGALRDEQSGLSDIFDALKKIRTRNLYRSVINFNIKDVQLLNLKPYSKMINPLTKKVNPYTKTDVKGLIANRDYKETVNHALKYEINMLKKDMDITGRSLNGLHLTPDTYLQDELNKLTMVQNNSCIQRLRYNSLFYFLNEPVTRRRLDDLKILMQTYEKSHLNQENVGIINLTVEQIKSMLINETARTNQLILILKKVTSHFPPNFFETKSSNDDQACTSTDEENRSRFVKESLLPDFDESKPYISGSMV